MSTRKIVLIIVGVIAALGLIVVLIAGGFFWLLNQKISSSEGAETARTFLRNNQTLRQDIGEVKDFGYFYSGSVNVQNTDGEATVVLKVIGEKRTVYATVNLSYRNNRSWRVTGATYEKDGQTIDLVQGYGPPATPTPPEN
jgi:hypothetical protein